MSLVPTAIDEAWSAGYRAGLDHAAKIIDGWPDEYPGISKNSPEYFASLDREIAMIAAIKAAVDPKLSGEPVSKLPASD